jgi:hypothetical protein
MWIWLLGVIVGIIIAFCIIVWLVAKYFKDRFLGG